MRGSVSPPILTQQKKKKKKRASTRASLSSVRVALTLLPVDWLFCMLGQWWDQGPGQRERTRDRQRQRRGAKKKRKTGTVRPSLNAKTSQEEFRGFRLLKLTAKLLDILRKIERLHITVYFHH